jgi:uncharacterized membrane protein
LVYVGNALQRNVLKKCSILSAGLAAAIVVAFTIGIGVAVRKFDSAPVRFHDVTGSGAS